MLDGADIFPLCIGTFVAILVGFLLIAFGPSIKEIQPKSDTTWIFIAILTFPIVCITTSLVYDGLSRSVGSRGCDHPPKDNFAEADIVGTWAGSISKARDSTIIIQAEGRYKQIINLEWQKFYYESDWKPWRITYSQRGLPYVHLQGFIMCAYWDAVDCRTGETGMPTFTVGGTKDIWGNVTYWYDFCQKDWVNTPGEAVFMVFDGGKYSPRGLALVPLTKSADGTSGSSYHLSEQSQ